MNIFFKVVVKGMPSELPQGLLAGTHGEGMQSKSFSLGSFHTLYPELSNISIIFTMTTNTDMF